VDNTTNIREGVESTTCIIKGVDSTTRITEAVFSRRLLLSSFVKSVYLWILSVMVL
jgi:hypothetical protein